MKTNHDDGEVSITLPDERRTSSDEHSRQTFYQGNGDEIQLMETHDFTEVVRECVKTFIEHIIVRVLGFLLIIVDITILIVSVSISGDSSDYLTQEAVFDSISLTIVCIFVMEILLRIFAKTPSVFFSRQQWYNVVDLVVIVLSFIITVTLITIDIEQSNSGRRDTDFIKFVVLGRLVRVFVFIRLFTERKNVEIGARLTVSQNKRRFRDDSFDLDLCYITDRVIAMSFPSSGKMALYRNPIHEVARFLNTKHTNHYKVYNLCSEKTYDTRPFEGRVKRIHIDDHNVPSLRELMEFCSDVELWMSESSSNVIAVHCKGGKGRTGTVISSWLLHCGAHDAANSLDIFCSQRTDFDKDSKVQGVETPSQRRYVGYYEEVKTKYSGQYPPSNKLKLRNIIIHSIRGVGSGDGKDLRLQMFSKRELIYEANMFTGANCVVTHRPQDNLVDLMLYDCPVVDEDVRIMFHSRLRWMPKYYENCLMYFWFHTSFVTENCLIIKRNDIDNLHKPKVWKMFQEDFSIELQFDSAGNST